MRSFSFVRDGHLLPPGPDVCQQCAVDHPPAVPHNPQSLFYQYWFQRQRGRWPNWGDAMAHCTPEVQSVWRVELAAAGVAESEFVVLDEGAGRQRPSGPRPGAPPG